MSKTERVKPEIDMKKMGSLIDVNKAMHTIQDLKAEIENKELEAEKKINSTREKVAKQVKPLLQKIKPLENGILAYAEYNKDELFEKKKTVDLMFGKLGFRKSTKISIKKTTLGLLKKFRFKDAINLKEIVNKETLSNWPNTQLEKVDAQRIVEDKFWYEVKREQVAEKVKSEK